MRFIRTSEAPAPVGPYSQAVRAGPYVFVSGQIGLTPDGTLVEGLAGQTEQALTNLRAVLNAAGLDIEDLVKTTVYLADISRFAEFNEIYARFMGDHRPARAVLEARLPKGALVEIEAVAHARE
jgi:2-iminobutanoate/2-iminopropanoate deaminase